MAWLLAWAPLAGALFGGTASPQPVVEFYNAILGHYFMTIDPAEIADIEAGKAGPAWVRTGWSFGAHPFPIPPDAACPFPAPCGVPVSRFYGTPGLGPNSHFYTADAAEAAGLDRPGTGWSFEKKDFVINVPDAAGQCGPGLVPVYRFYNMRFMFNDSNHRYVTSAAERERMRALGWFDEGVRFCAWFAGDSPIRSFEIGAPTKVMPSAQCEDESVNIGPCVAVNNLATPNRFYVVPTQAAPGSREVFEFFDRTGLFTSTALVVDPSLPAPLASADVFVQRMDAPAALGIHVDTVNRKASLFSSVNPLYQFHNSAGPGLRDDRFFPFAGYESAAELAISFELHVRRIRLRSPDSAAYGHPTLEFVDTRSGHHVYFTVLAYGTVPPTDYLAPDVGTGKVIVGTTFRPDASYGRSVRDSMLVTPDGFDDPDISLASHGNFEFRMNRAEFAAALAAARTVDPAVSSDPADYLMDNFHFNNEVFGDGEIGITLTNYRLQLLRR